MLLVGSHFLLTKASNGYDPARAHGVVELFFTSYTLHRIRVFFLNLFFVLRYLSGKFPVESNILCCISKLLLLPQHIAVL